MTRRIVRLNCGIRPAAAILFVVLGVAAAPAGAPSAGSGAPDPGAPVGTELSPPQMLAEVTAYVPQLEAGALRVREQVEQARVARDVVKLLCLRDKLSQIEVALASARDRAEALRGAAGRGDREVATHEFVVLNVLRDHVQAMVAEANQCIGEEEGFIGDSEVVMEVDPDIPDEGADFFDDPLLSVPPLTTSPIQ